ncbi:hypothetical protein [Rhodonellum sp.]|uniref:hypothetical protein n=1 Tax=Rhodonellum sp. TaxID=2231180 RepID=UPI0027191A7C|nr:hypothetical protein [Rhodonellum sp.]MDO9553855.1 hypothetical protein [Rhodonellum sp.]
MKVIAKEVFTQKIGDSMFSVFELEDNNIVAILYDSNHPKINLYKIDKNGKLYFENNDGKRDCEVTVIEGIKIKEVQNLNDKIIKFLSKQDLNEKDNDIDNNKNH